MKRKWAAPSFGSTPDFVNRYFPRSNYVHMAISRRRETSVSCCPRLDRLVSSVAMDNMTNLNLSSRKLRKPLMERKRRARINRSLDELYQLLTETDFAAKGTKLEKADILELTVQYLKQIKQHGDSAEAKENLENVLLERYLSGFERCAEEIEILVDPHLRHRLRSHLQGCLEGVRSQERGAVEGEHLKVLRSRLPSGDVLLLLSSSDRQDRLDKVWRPWW